MMCCYYPTTTIAIDDDTDFLRIVTQHLGIMDCISYSYPNEAVKYILKNQKSFDRIKSRILRKTTTTPEDINSFPEDYTILVNMHGLHEEIYNKNRFQDVSVLIVDYYMAGLDGINVCEELANHPAKKILLTGGADKEKIAIEAFNKGIIHRFINKADSNFPNKLKQAVTLLKDAYFRDLSLTLQEYIPAASSNLLQNPAYVNFVKNLQEQFNSVEYYLIDATGSILYLDIDSTPMWLIIKHESDINDYKRIAQAQDADESIIHALENQKMIPFFFNEEDYLHPVNEWNRFLYESHPVPGLTNYYYANVKGHAINNLNKEKIVSYGMYQKTNTR